MRRLTAFVTILAVTIGALWLGGETLAARSLRDLVTNDPSIGIEHIRELREPGRIGIGLTQVSLVDQDIAVELSSLDVWLPPLLPIEARATLPATLELTLNGRQMAVGLSDPVARLRVAPFSGFVPAQFQLATQAVSLDGTALWDRVDVRADLSDMDDAPAFAAQSYDISVDIDELRPEPLLNGATLPVPGRFNLAATGRGWIDAGGAVVGVQIDQSALSLGQISGRIIGRISLGADGRADGALAIYSADAEPLLQAAAEAGLIPGNAVTFGGAVLRNVANQPPPPTQGVNFPEPAQGELRLPLIFTKGKVWLGPIPLGPSPMLAVH